MTTKDAKEYMNRLEIPQLFESMLTGLLYNKPADHLQFLGECINSAKEIESLKWDTFLDRSKKPLPAIPRTTDGPIRSETFGLSDEPVFPTFETEPILEMKIQSKLPGIRKDSAHDSDDVDNDQTIKETLPQTQSEGSPTQQDLFKNQSVIFVLGGPGSGKGTQCAKIVEHFGLTHLSAGELLREEVKQNSERAALIAEFIKDGKIVPHEITIGLLKDSMLKHPESRGFLIDGFPRELDQGSQFEQGVRECDFVLFFECSEQVMEDRLLKRGETSGRSDDNSETIQKRFKTFTDKTLPVVQHYDSINKLRKVDACREVEDVFQSVCELFTAAEILPKKERTQPTLGTAAEDLPTQSFQDQRILFVLGGPGCGKGTQCAKIVEKFGYSHLSTGDLLREELTKDTERARMMGEMMKDGKLVPQEIIVELLKDAMLQCPQSPGFLIDGFPRELGQARQFENELAECDKVVFFECSEEVMERRLLKRGETSGREDDNSETIKKRFHTYIEKTLPVIEYYETLKKVNKIDATRDVDEVFEDVCQMFSDVANVHSTEKDETNVELKDAELKDAVNDLFAHMEKREERDEEEKTHKTQELVEEPVITSSELLPLGDLKTALPPEKSLLNARVVFVIGGPGCGKGTQCAKIVESFKYTHLSTGDLLRSEVSSGSPRGQELSAIMKKGDLVPMETVLQLLRDAIIKQPNTIGFLIDGFPRELEQAVQFENEIAVCECVLYFECSADTMTARLLKRADTSGRVDDNEETIKKRLDTFFTQTLPVVEHFEEKGNIHKIAAEGNPEEIFVRVKGILDDLPQRG